MASELAVLENEFKPLMPRYEQVLAGRMPAERLMRTVLVSVEKTPKLLQCTRQSLFNAAMSAAVLALEVDGVTGQAFIIPYAQTAQLQIGYKGLNTLGARSGYSINARCVREGDTFDYDLGSKPFISHKPRLGNDGRIIAAWAVGTSKDLSPIFSLLSLEEIMAVKAKSQGAKKADSPWNDPSVGFVAMAEKTARRRLARSMPLNVNTRDYHLAARMDEAFDEQGKPSWIREDGAVMIEGAASPIAERQSSDTPSLQDLKGPRPDAEYAALMAEGEEAAEGGMMVVAAWWDRLTPRQKEALKDWKETTLKPLARKADQANDEAI